MKTASIQVETVIILDRVDCSLTAIRRDVVIICQYLVDSSKASAEYDVSQLAKVIPYKEV